MSSYTILCVSDDPMGGSIGLSLRNKAHQLLIAGSPTQAMAYLFINRRIDAVIIDQQSQPCAGLNTAHLLRTVRADVPILLLSSEPVEPLPFCVDACFSRGELPDKLLLSLDLLLARPSDSLAPVLNFAR